MTRTVANNFGFANMLVDDAQKIFAYRSVMRRKTQPKNEAYRRSGELIAEARNAKGLTQQGLATKLGMKRQRVQNWESGVAMPRPQEMQQLASEIGLTVDEITRGERGPKLPAQQNLEIIPSGQRIAFLWDQLPRAGKEYIAEQMAAMMRFQEEDADLAAHVFSTPSSETMKKLMRHEKKIIEVQEKTRRTKAKPRDDDND